MEPADLHDGYASMAKKLFHDCLTIYVKQNDPQGIAKCQASLALLG